MDGQGRDSGRRSLSLPANEPVPTRGHNLVNGLRQPLTVRPCSTAQPDSNRARYSQPSASDP